MLLLLLWVRVRQGRAWLAQPIAQLPKDPLALPHTEFDFILLLDPGGQRLAVPETSSQAYLARHAVQDSVNLLQLLLAQSPWPARPFSFAQSRQPLFLESSHPILYRARGITEQFRYLRAGYSVGYQKYSMEPVIVAGFVGSSDLILQSENHGGRIFNREWLHIPMKPQVTSIRNYL